MTQIKAGDRVMYMEDDWDEVPQFSPGTVRQVFPAALLFPSIPAAHGAFIISMYFDHLPQKRALVKDTELEVIS